MKIRVLEVIRALLLHLLAVDWIKWNPPIPGQRENIVFTLTYKGLSLIVEFCGTHDATQPKGVTITLNNNGRVLGFGGWNWYDCDGFMWFKYNNFHDCIEALRTYIEEASETTGKRWNKKDCSILQLVIQTLFTKSEPWLQEAELQIFRALLVIRRQLLIHEHKAMLEAQPEVLQNWTHEHITKLEKEKPEALDDAFTMLDPKSIHDIILGEEKSLAIKIKLNCCELRGPGQKRNDKAPADVEEMNTKFRRRINSTTDNNTFGLADHSVMTEGATLSVGDSNQACYRFTNPSNPEFPLGEPSNEIGGVNPNFADYEWQCGRPADQINPTSYILYMNSARRNQSAISLFKYTDEPEYRFVNPSDLILSNHQSS